MIRFLASVRSAEETAIAAEGGADIVDFKEPDKGALGALDVERIRTGIETVAGRCETSATVGDWPLDPDILATETHLIGETGVDYVKIGLLPGEALGTCIGALGRLAGRYRLVAVFFADLGVPAEVVPLLARCGFHGVLVDTFGKHSGGLLDHWNLADIRSFVATAQTRGLLTGLAGSLRAEDIPVLASVGPDLLGFRGALCARSDRRETLARDRVAGIRDALARHRPVLRV